MATKRSVHRLFRHMPGMIVATAIMLSSILAALPSARVQAAPAAMPDVALSIVEVAAPDINGVFDLDKTIIVDDLASNFTPPGANGNGFLQSRLWPVGEAGTAGAGKYAYLYRIDLTRVTAITAVSCVTSMTIDFGPVAPLDYNGDSTPDQVFVITKGGLGSVKPAAAVQSGSAISFRFDPAICPGATSFFFGLASTESHRPVAAQVTGTLGLAKSLAARAPKRPDAGPGCYEIFRPEEIPSPALINFDDLPDATTVADTYLATYGVSFYAGGDTRVLTYADRPADPTAARSPHNVATNDAVWPETSANKPLTFRFASPKTHVGFFMGNGETAGLAGAMVGYDAAGNVVCQITNTPVPEKFEEFIGMYDPAGRIATVTLNYGNTLLSEAIDDLYFAPFGGGDPAPLFGSDGEGVAIKLGESSSKLFQATFAMPAPQLLPVLGPDQVQYQHFLLPGIDPNGSTPGQPDVPVYRRLLAVPAGARPFVDGLRIEPGAEITGILYPSQPAPADQQRDPRDFGAEPFTKDEKAYASDSDFPAQPVTLERIGKLRDLEVWQVNIAGGQYNPAKGILRTYASIGLQIGFEGGSGGFLPRATADNPFEQSFDGIYDQVLNRAAIHTYLDDIVFRPICLGYEYLIITDPAFRPAADALRTWKISKGISTRVIETGNGAGQAGTTNAAIRDTIKGYYDGCLVRPSYVLLLGDAEHIAPFYRNTHYGDNAGTDLDYSLMTAGDIMPDLAYGRIPVDSLADAQAIVDKIVAYEDTPPFNFAFYRNISVASYFQCCRPDVVQDGTASRSFVETSEFVRDELTSLGYTVQRIYTTDTSYHNDPTEPAEFYNTATRSATPNRYYNGTLLPADLRAGSGFAWNGDTADVIDAINAGRFLVIHRDHGWIDGWGDPDFDTGDLGSLTNGNLTPVVYSINCASGLFDNETLNPALQNWNYGTAVGSSYWAEQLLRMDGGAVGIIGDTRVSPTWANSALTRGLIDATWQNLLPATGGGASIRRLGDILNYGKSYMVSQVGVAQTAGSVTNNQANTNLALYHVFGDPTLEMWTGYPYIIKLPRWYELIEFTPIRWKFGYPVDGATITALQEGNPVARTIVRGGIAELSALGDGSDFDPDKPVQFVATHPDGQSEVLEERTASGNVGQNGGSIEHPATGFRIDFPAGAVPGDTTIFYDPTINPPAPTGNGQNGLRFFELDAFNGDGSVRTHFDLPWSMELGYDENELGGVDENGLQCTYFDEESGQWLPVQTQVDAANNRVICQADHFTHFALVAAAPGSGDAANHLYLPVVTR